MRYDSGRVALFQPDNTFVFIDGQGAAAPVEGPMLRVRKGETVIRSHAPAEDGVFSGLTPSTTARTVNELLAPIGKDGVIGAICLGRNASTGFNQQDASALEELGSMARASPSTRASSQRSPARPPSSTPRSTPWARSRRP